MRQPNTRMPYVRVCLANLLFVFLLERFSIECRKTKTRVITLANHKGHR